VGWSGELRYCGHSCYEALLRKIGGAVEWRAH
jgi:hypothetical protein